MSAELRLNPAARSGGGEEVILDVRDNVLLELWKCVCRHHSVMIALASVGAVLGIGVSFMQKPAYLASSLIEIQEVNEDFMNLKNVMPVSRESPGISTDDVQTYIRKLQSRALLSAVVEKLGMVHAQTKSGWWRKLRHPAGESSEADPVEAAIDQSQAGLQIREIGRSRLIEIAFSSESPRQAADFANSLASEFLAENVLSRGSLTQNVSAWIANQLKEMRANLVDSERALEKYARTSGMVFIAAPGGAGEVGTAGASLSGEKLREVQNELSQAEADRMSKESQYELSEKTPVDSLPFLANDAVIRAQQDKLTDLYRQKAELGVNYTPRYATMKSLEAQINVLQGALAQSRGTIRDQIKNDYLAAVGREKLLLDKYRKQSDVVTEESLKSVQYQMLKREVESNRQLYDELLQRTKQAGAAAALRANNIRVVDPARVPVAPYKPNLPLSAAVGLLGGLGVGAAWITVFTSRSTINQPGELKKIGGVSELGTIISSREHRILARFALINSSQQPSAIAQSYRSVLTSLHLADRNNNECSVFAFTSASAVEGKTTVLSSLAVVLASMRQRVLVVDGDIYKPELHNRLDGCNDKGFADLLRDFEVSKVKLSDFIQITAIPNLSLLASGNGDGLTPLLFSPQLQNVLQRLRQSYDFVLIDTPPMLEVADARILGKHSDAV
ncbi:MAG TPA: polysaccharide biosynthesis tyrosine autokinase, partial [Edaphobacter sp.]|nr:polysaccharide biosynthesis tyrosine autokinase [Edaphobacter sp.]